VKKGETKMPRRVIKVGIISEYSNAMKNLIHEGKYKSQADFINRAVGGHLKRYYKDRITEDCPHRLRSIENSRKDDKNAKKQNSRLK
jgi:Arc/MetJ-type ribon-helix-helix transcriptional regulator